MKRPLPGKRVLVTGASSGIGRCVAEQAALAGMRVVVSARSAGPLEELAASLRSQGKDVHAVPGDVTSPADRERMLQAVVDHFGGLDVLVNNAGIGSQGLFTESSEELLRQVMEVNFFASAELIRLAVPVLTNGQQPAIVQVASMCGRRGVPCWSEYSASKFAVCGLIEALRAEMVRFGIDVVLIVPGLTHTSLDRNLIHTNGRMIVNFEKGMRPEKVARKILRALERNRAETVLGWEAHWIIRANRFMPWLVDRVLKRVVNRIYATDPLEPNAGPRQDQQRG